MSRIVLNYAQSAMLDFGFVAYDYDTGIPKSYLKPGYMEFAMGGNYITTR